MELEELRKFFEDINSIKHIERQGWKDKGVKSPRDTIASHSFGAALLGWSLAEEKDFDSDKIVKMLLIHDLIMAYVEDYTPEDEEFESKREMEENAKDKLLEDIPENIRPEFEELFDEFQALETEEAVLAKESDKLDTLMQALTYSEELDQDILSEFIESYRQRFNTDTGKQILSQLEQVKISED